MKSSKRVLLYVSLLSSLLTFGKISAQTPTSQEIEDNFFNITKFEQLESLVNNNGLLIKVRVDFRGRVTDGTIECLGFELLKGKTVLYGIPISFLKNKEKFFLKILGFWKELSIPSDDNNPIINFTSWKQKELTASPPRDTVINGVPHWSVYYTSRTESYNLSFDKATSFISEIFCHYHDTVSRESKYTIYLSRYNSFGGIIFPHSMKLVMEGKKDIGITLNSINFNNALKEEDFALPK